MLHEEQIDVEAHSYNMAAFIQVDLIFRSTQSLSENYFFF